MSLAALAAACSCAPSCWTVERSEGGRPAQPASEPATSSMLTSATLMGSQYYRTTRESLFLPGLLRRQARRAPRRHRFYGLLGLLLLAVAALLALGHLA